MSESPKQIPTFCPASTLGKVSKLIVCVEELLHPLTAVAVTVNIVVADAETFSMT